PAGGGPEHLVELAELRNPAVAQAEALHAFDELLPGAPRQQFALALEQGVPYLVLGLALAGPGLLDHTGGVHRHVATIGLLMFDFAGLGVFHGLLRVQDSEQLRANRGHEDCFVAKPCARFALLLRHTNIRRVIIAYANPGPYRPAHARRPPGRGAYQQYRAGRAGQPVAFGLPAPAATAGVRENHHRLRGPDRPAVGGPGPAGLRAGAVEQARA